MESMSIFVKIALNLDSLAAILFILGLILNKEKLFYCAFSIIVLSFASLTGGLWF